MQPLENANRPGFDRSSPLSADRILAWLRTPRGLIIAGIGIILAGLALGWNWLTALGLAPLILSVAPCAVMCALGMCMMGGGKKSPVKANQPDAVERLTGSAPPSSNESAP
jgi:hypothetical protein